MGWHAISLLAVIAVVLALSNGQANSPPLWDDASVEAFVTISEATAEGTQIGNLRCIDPEGDPIRYGLRSGTAVKVRSNGAVTLDVPLDFEKTDAISYDLTFTCVDVNRTSGRALHNPIEFRTVISPNDANDNAPRFSINSPDGNTFFISEAAPVGTVLDPPVEISDADRGNNAILDQLYIICNSQYPAERINLTESSIATCEKFAVSSNPIGEGRYTATLRIINPLDYEDRRTYSSKLIAIDGSPTVTPKLTTTVNIQIVVQDAQDNLPIFTNIGESASVNEAAVVGSTVADFGISARDGDFGDKREVRLTIIEDALDAFDLSPTRLVNSADGIYESNLIVKNQLDRESIATAYEFVVKVTELNATGAETDATATATYSVFITDFNDNPPTFSQEIYYVNVTEVQSNVPVQINGFRIDCNDPDETINARYTVRVVNQSFPTYSVTPSLQFTGSASMFLQVEDSRYLDYDNPLYRNQRVVLEAREVGTNPPLSSSATILISLRDINDNSPSFTETSYESTISESVSTFPYNFLTLTAGDRDSGDNGRVRYRLEGETANLFEIDAETGELFLLQPVDYETTPQYVFLAYAYDSAETPRQTQVQVTVDILNFNDQGPRFLLPVYQTSVNESRLTFFNPINITAVDTEDGTAAITYRIVSGQSDNNAFTINPNTGDLTLRDYLNYESTPLGADGRPGGVFTLMVEASDNGQPPQTNTVPVIITVIDVNDHSPIVNPRLYSVRLSELAPPGTFITKIMATDDDGGSFGTITYRIGQGLSDNFFVNPETGNITVGTNRVFDYDVQSSYELEVIASDGGAPQKSATATVFIEILDGNNQPPQFAELLYYVYVDEKVPVNTVVQTIRAVDLDSTAELVYSILPSPFRASDPDGNTLSATSSYDYRNAFDVNNQGGIYVKNPLSREAANEISFTLQARDVNQREGSATGTTQVTIVITGEASTNITFDQATTVYMNENANPGYNAITVTARDPNNNAVQNYEMIPVPGSSNDFEVLPNGRIVLVRPIDYENDPQVDHLHRVVVRAISNDGTQSATITSTISIVDVNDNAPLFSRRVYEANVPETFIYPMEVATIFATDADSKSYGPLEFRISGGLDSDDFFIFQEPENDGSRVSRRATVLVAPGTTLDYNRRSQYNLDITVLDNVDTDYSSARLSTNARLIIRVIDENNNTPYFVESVRNLAVPETAQIDQSIATLIAIDQDVGRNGDIIYVLEAIDDPNSEMGLELFTISRVGGVVRVRGNLLGQGGKVYPMRVRARDQGDRANSGYMRLNINVQSTEDDDGNPKWIRPVNGYVVTAPEDTPNYVLRDANGRTQFLDATARTGTGIVFALSPAGEYANSFRINATTGEIVVVVGLDRERQEFYNLLVYAEDTLNPSVIRSGRQLVVQLTDKDDNDPTFTNPNNYDQCEAIDRPLVVYVRENTVTDVGVYQLRACDPDLGANSGISYELYNDNTYCAENNAESIFRLNSTTGDLVTKEDVDYEQGSDYYMCVRANSISTASSGKRRKKRAFDMDRVDASLDNVAYIHLVIVDENDNGPRFPADQLIAVVENQPETGPVVTLTATDPDGPTNSVILYRITSSEFIPQGSSQRQAAADVFTLRGASGALYPALPSYRRFSRGRFVLTVRAIDGSNPAFTDDVEVTIYVYEQGQATKIILGDEPSDAIVHSVDMIRALNDVSRTYSFTYLQLSEHRTKDGFEADKTDVCFLAVDERTKDILNIRQVISVLDQDNYRNILSRSQYNQVDRGQCYPSKSSEEDIRWRDLWWVLVAIAIFIFVCCIILLILIVLLYDRYRRYMKTRQTYLVSQ